MADIDQVRDKNHEGDNMANQHGAIIVFTEHMTETKKKGKGRRDVGWQHGVAIDGKASKVKCNYCHEEYSSGGVFRFKHHLAGTRKNVAPCRAVPNDVRLQMLDKVNKSQSNLIEKRKRTPSEDVQDNEAKKKLMRCVRILDGLEGIGGGPFTKALKILKEDPLWRDVFLALSDDRKKDFVLNL
ncbi:DNA binding protein [Trifolium pratense]|uniref:DNA binding protein n=1 Tax=Trifolium pratense TaxID=57577 RepID=A0A2K3KY45_TRIPR|nr:DNA binding protein [Trifolium pratense]